MDIGAIAVGVTALATAIGAAVKQIYDNKALRKWICTRNPCDERVSQEPPS